MNFYMFRAVPLPIIRSSITAHLALVYVTGFEDSFQAGPAGPAWKLSSSRMPYTRAKCTVSELLMMGRGTARNM